MTAEKQFNKGGRPPKSDPCRHRYSIKLNDVDNARFLFINWKKRLWN
jgi:hypothetical protein